jgi:hypothetical protein
VAVDTTKASARRVVRDRDRLHDQPADRARLPGRHALVGRDLRAIEPGRDEGALRAGERHAPLPREARGAPGVVAMLVRHEDCVERGRIDPRRLQPLGELPRPEPRVQQDARPAALDERRVALAPRSEQPEAQAHTVNSA